MVETKVTINNPNARIITYSKISIFLIALFAFSTSFWKYIYLLPTMRMLSLCMSALLIAFPFIRKRLEAPDIFLLLTFIPLFTNNQNIAAQDYYFIIIYIVLVIFFVSNREKEGWQSSGMKFMILAGIFYASFTIWFYIDKDFYINKVIGIFPEENQRMLLIAYMRGAAAGLTKHYSLNAGLLVIGITASISYFMAKRKSILINIILISTMTISLLLTGKRAHIVFIAASIIVAYYLYNSNKKKGRILKIMLLIAGIVLIIMLLATFIPDLNLFYTRFIETSEAGDVSLGRFMYYNQAWNIFMSNPLFGIGWGGFKYYYVNYTDVYTAVHNVYLQLLCEIGIVGCLPFLLFFITMYRNSLLLFMDVRRQKYNIGENAQRYLIFSVIIQTFFLLYCLTGNPLYDAEILFPYIYGCSLCMYYKNNLIKD